jgi:hypothetical protein
METNKYSTFFSIVDVIHKDKEISDFSKLIFYDIAYLCLFKGANCYAANNFFAQKYHKSEGTVSKAISSLTNKGFIERYVDQNKNRKIYLKFSKFKSNGSNSHPVGLSEENKDWRNIETSEEISLVRENTTQDYSPIKRDKSQLFLSSKIISRVSEQFKIENPIKTMENLLPRLLDQNKYFKLEDIVRTLISLITERSINKIQEDLPSYFETFLGLKIVSFKRSEGGRIFVNSLKSDYILSLAEYLILHLYNLAKETSIRSKKDPRIKDSDLYSIATDTYEIIWHKLSIGEKMMVKGKLINVNIIKGKGPDSDYAYLKLMNPDNQEITIQVSSKNYKSSIQNIHLGKGKDVAIYGPVQYNKRKNQNIVILFEIVVNTPEIYEEDE